MGEEKAAKDAETAGKPQKDGDQDKKTDETDVQNRLAEEPRGRLFDMEEKWKLMYNENNRSPTYSVSHYVAYLRRYVNATSQLRVAVTGKTTERFSRKGLYDRSDSKPTAKDTQKSLDSISPMSYFIRKLKLDLKLAFSGFVEEFIQAPSNGLHLLVMLLRNMQVLSANPGGGMFTRAGAKGSLKMEEYKKNMIDEQDCLLCIKYTLRARNAVEELLDNNVGLLTVTSCVLSNFSKSRITALEIVTLLLTDPPSVDRVLDAFTSMRIKHAEGCRFKMLINMLYTRGVSHVLFQVSCLRMLNTLLNLCKSANMRVFLQYEIEEAGLDLNRIQQNAAGDGLEYDDLRKEIWEWKMRYIDVDAILRKIRSDLKMDAPESAVTEFNYDQHFGPAYAPDTNNLYALPIRPNHEDPRNAPAQSLEIAARKRVAVNGTDSHLTNQPPLPPRRPEAAVSTNTPNVANGGVAGQTSLNDHGGRREPGQLPLHDIISRTASPANPRPTRALKDPSNGSVSRDFKSGKFTSVTTELWEPNGLVLRPDPATSEAAFFPKGASDEPEIHSSANWALNSAFSTRQGGVREHEGDADTKHFTVLSKVSFSSEDENEDFGIGEEKSSKNKEKNEVGKNVSKDTSRLFYSPKTSGLDSGPLRWFNPGITLPPSSTERESSRPVGGTAKEFGSVKPPTPPPDYKQLTTPPPDYDSDNDDHLETTLHRRRRALSMPSTETARNDYSHPVKRNANGSQNYPPSVTAPRITSSIKSNFQRMPAVRRKSFSELSKQRSDPSPVSSVWSREDPQSPPPLPPPRVVYSTATSTSTATLFYSGHVQEDKAKASHKQATNKYVRHSDSRSAATKTSKPRYSPAVSATTTLVSSYGTENTHTVYSTLKASSDVHSHDNAASTEGTTQAHHSNNSSIPLGHTPVGVTKEKLEKMEFKHQTTEPRLQKFDTVTEERVGIVSKSIIMVSSDETPTIHRDTTSLLSAQVAKSAGGKALPQSRQTSKEKATTDSKFISSSPITEKRLLGRTPGTNPHPVARESQATHVPTAITITSPTPPSSTSPVNDVVQNMIRSKRSPLVFEGNNIKPAQVTHNSNTPTHVLKQSSSEHGRTDKDTLNRSKHEDQPTAKAASNEPRISQAGENSDSQAVPGQPSAGAAVAHNRQDSALSYTSEIGRVLGELDHTLETHGWQASLKQHVKKSAPPLVAYV